MWLWIILIVVAIVLLIWWLTSIYRQPSLVGATTSPKRLYLAGPLFSIQDLQGNITLATAIEQVSQGRYQVVLPQDQEQENKAEVRQQDLRLVRDLDGIIVNANGADLDSGTVIEFIVSKAYNKPAVMLRTDFRSFTDDFDTNPLMYDFPRTEYLHIDGIEEYQRFNRDIDATTLYVAKQVVEAMDRVQSMTAAPTNLNTLFNI